LTSRLPASPPHDPESNVTPLAWLAGAICGRSLSVEYIPGRESAYTDGAIIFVPAALDLVDQRCAVIAQALLLTAGSFDREIITGLRLRPGIERRYFSHEVSRAAHEYADRVPQLFFSKYPMLKRIPASWSPQQSLALAIARSGEELPAALGTLKPFRLSSTKLDAFSRGTHAKAASAVDASKDKDTDELNAAQRDLANRFSTPLKRGLGFADVLLRLLGYRRSAGAATDAEASSSAPLASGSVEQHIATIASRTVVGKSAAAQTRAAQSGMTLPEWDYHQNRYRLDYVHLREILPLADETARTSSLRTPVPGLPAALARAGMEFERVHAQSSGADLDLDALIGLKVEHRLRHSPHENVYIDSRATRRDITVLLLLDISQSTGETDAQGVSMLTKHRDLGAEIVRTFAQLGARVAFCGFHSWGRMSVRIVHLKRFDEQPSKMAERLSALTPAGLTRMGAALRYGTDALTHDHHHVHKLMLMLTDGFAYDDGYEGRYARADTAQALREAETAGVASVCVHLGTDQADSILGELYGEGAYLCARNGLEIARPLGRVIDAALRRASHARFGRRAQGRGAPRPGARM